MNFYVQGRAGHLKHVFNVMRRLGYEDSTIEDNWDVLWSHPYPFTILPALKHLKPYQKVRKFYPLLQPQICKNFF